MDKLESMGAFVKVVASGSYAEAARRLGLTRSAVSKAVMELEQQLGARLLDRTTRHVTPTEAGLAYYERCIAILAQVDETEAQISRLHDEPKGVLKINAPMSFGTLYLGDAVADFMIRYGDLKVELTLTDRFIDPLEEGVDVTVRIGALVDSSLIARRISPARVVIVASPDYLKKHGTPQNPAELANHRCLSYGHTTSMQRWHLKENDRPISVSIGSCLSSNNGDALRDAAVKGIGIAQLPTFIVGKDIAENRLQVVLPDYEPDDLTIHALYAPNRYLAAKTRVFIDFLVDRFGKTPSWDVCYGKR
ncbi:LysR family transcriptional regulator [Hyphomicrobium denitrificans 1NES1]|uniref:LysR family transcriptional regulator n=1 Tax=Hyphomicrobium denitrificans 1NES1 TaxID=670307 RepID=N0BGS3_9HYPH|nr:LysR family transcriptional regulator [Hyphomicrobium denitrificans]AGK59345.1 LysR family transcriptional regulator [Hyphomicrobium denitrificans 1NES1]